MSAALGGLTMAPATASPSVDGASTTATAPDQPEHTGAVKRITKGMTVVGFDREVAEANGYEIITRPDGTQASVKKGELTTQGSSTVVGSCGISFVELFDAPGTGGKADFRTGFTTYEVAIGFRWWVIVRDANGTSNRNYAGDPFSRSWQTGFETLWLYPGGNAWATVIPDDSWALLANGSICVSGGPGTVEWID
jgi:hypothetical protein